MKQSEKGNTYPSAVDYLVCPPEVQAVFGEKPRQLRIVIPVEDDEKWANQYLKYYSRSRGLVCKGDGDKAWRAIDKATGDVISAETKDYEMRECSCTAKDCPDYKAKKCKEVMNLMFMIPEVAGLGVYQIDTSSVNGIKNINASAEMLRALYGRVCMIPLTLTMTQIDVINPDDHKKKKVWVLQLGSDCNIFEMKSRIAEIDRTLSRGLVNEELPSPDDETPELLLGADAEVSPEAAMGAPKPMSPDVAKAVADEIAAGKKENAAREARKDPAKTKEPPSTPSEQPLEPKSAPAAAEVVKDPPPVEVAPETAHSAAVTRLMATMPETMKRLKMSTGDVGVCCRRVTKYVGPQTKNLKELLTALTIEQLLAFESELTELLNMA